MRHEGPAPGPTGPIFLRTSVSDLRIPNPRNSRGVPTLLGPKAKGDSTSSGPRGRGGFDSIGATGLATALTADSPVETDVRANRPTPIQSVPRPAPGGSSLPHRARRSASDSSTGSIE
jgi:hypothetical protein